MDTKFEYKKIIIEMFRRKKTNNEIKPSKYLFVWEITLTMNFRNCIVQSHMLDMLKHVQVDPRGNQNQYKFWIQ